MQGVYSYESLKKKDPVEFLTSFINSSVSGSHYLTLMRNKERNQELLKERLSRVSPKNMNDFCWVLCANFKVPGKVPGPKKHNENSYLNSIDTYRRNIVSAFAEMYRAKSQNGQR
jgi:hypothetical protein